MAAVPEGANMGLGCGNPQALAALQPGETVLDLGCGGGFDCFLAAQQVGDTGRVIGVDMTPEMLAKARRNAEQGGYHNVEFRLGEIEHLPLADHSVDVIISNCVINLSPDKAQVFSEAFRVLRSGGRLALSDVVALSPLPEELQNNTEAYTCCAAGAAPLAELEAGLRQAGFNARTVTINEESRDFIKDWLPGSGIEDFVRSAMITAWK
jgi:SAM-dependent methyltransferase